MLYHPILPLLIHIFQSAVDILHLRSKLGKFPAYIGSDLFMAVDTFVFLNVLGHFFGDHIMVSKQIAKERGEFVAMLGSGSFHKFGFVLGAHSCDLGIGEMQNQLIVIFLYTFRFGCIVYLDNDC